MSRKIKIYLDTSVINFLFADDAPQYKTLTEDFFAYFINMEVYQTYISDFVIEEIENTSSRLKRDLLLNIVSDYPIEILETTQEADLEIESLAKKYISAGIIPQKKYMDALHIAISVYFDIQYLVSWNFKHLANINKEAKVLIVNLENGYLNNFRIITPLELMNDEN